MSAKKQNKNKENMDNRDAKIVPSKPENMAEFQFVDPANEEKEKQKFWMYDTPGLMNTNQVSIFSRREVCIVRLQSELYGI